MGATGMLRNIAILCVGLVFAAIAGFLTWQTIEETETETRTTPFLVYSANASEPVLRPGASLTSGDVVTIGLPSGVADSLVGTLIPATDENRRFVTLRPVNAEVPRGRFLTYDLFEDTAVRRLDEQISIGRRAVTIPVNSSSSLNNRVVPGNRIDLMSVLDSTGVARTELVLADVRVIAVGGIFSLEEYLASGESSYSTITIEVTPDEGMLLAARREEQQGGFSVMLRNQCDTAGDTVGCN